MAVCVPERKYALCTLAELLPLETGCIATNSQASTVVWLFDRRLHFEGRVDTADVNTYRNSGM